MSYLFIFLGAALRFIPHAANFAPIGAMALFGGAKINKKYALIIPLAAMLISDYFIGFYSWQIMASVYSSFLIYGLLGLWARKNESWLKIGGATLAGSVLFFSDHQLCCVGFRLNVSAYFGRTFRLLCGRSAVFPRHIAWRHIFYGRIFRTVRIGAEICRHSVEAKAGSQSLKLLCQKPTNN